MEKEKEQLENAKKMHIDFFMTSFQRDAVGMPAVMADAVDPDLRGVNPTFQTDEADPYVTNLAHSARNSLHGSMESITSAGELEESQNHADHH